ncbi:MAG: response regulator [Clostridia bacterium]|nr:response regulator [Clostridia bacterium]
MITVAIIDDEALVRIGLKSLIDWEANGFHIIGEASNGLQGMELIREKVPDIAIIDIKMPVMSGLEVIQSIRNEEKKVKFIVLSSFDEFQLVKQAMKLGACDYLIKLELEPDVLLHALNQVKYTIEEELKEQGKKESLERQVRINKSAIMEEFFKKLIAKVHFDKQEIDEYLKLLEVSLNENRIACACTKVTDIENLGKFEKHDIHLFDLSIMNVINEIVNGIFIGYTFKWNHGEYLTVFSWADDWMEDLFRQKAAETAERLVYMIGQYFNTPVSIGISNVYHSFRDMDQLFTECSQAIQYSFYKGPGRAVFFHETLGQAASNTGIDMKTYKNDMLKAIETSNAEALKKVFDHLIYELENKSISREKTYDLCCQFAYHAINHLYISEDALNRLVGFNNGMFQEISRQTSLPGIIDWLRKLENGLTKILSSNFSQHGDRIIARAKRYINEHFQDEISLNDIAEELKLSPGYFSSMFKQGTGQNFVDYVTEVKINNAKRLLTESNLKIYEVSNVLGYENPYYFSRVFKKVTGMTPSEYVLKSIRNI